MLKYENSLTENDVMRIDSKAFLQFVFDNADHNVRTIDDHGTFHVMGGIQCVTPANLLQNDLPVPRPKKLTKSDTIGQYGNIKIQMYNRRKNSGLGKIIFSDLSLIKIEPPTAKIAELLTSPFQVGVVLWIFQ